MVNRFLDVKRHEARKRKEKDTSPLAICDGNGRYVSTDGVKKTRIVYHDYKSAFESCQTEGRR